MTTPPNAQTEAMRKMEAALVAIIDLALDEPGGLNFAHRASELARDALGWEKITPVPDEVTPRPG